PIAPHAIPKRAESRQLKGAPRPERPVNKFCLGTFTLSNTSSPVVEARRDHFPLVSGVLKPSIPLSTISPCIRPLSSLAHTTAISAIGELVIHILAPF